MTKKKVNFTYGKTKRKSDEKWKFFFMITCKKVGAKKKP